MNVCEVPSCNKPIRSLTYCVTHYHRVWRNGDPHTLKRTLTGTPMEQRLTTDKWTKVVRTLSTPCWEWNQHKDTSGYGRIKYNGKSLKLHRIMFEREYGAIPQGKSVLHRCDNPPCSNPEHLFVGTQRENIEDMDEKGRRVTPGPLSDDKVRSIRAMVAGGMKQAEVCRIEGVDSSTVSRIVNRRLYKSVS